MTTFLFLRVTHDLSCESGDARRAALRPSIPIPVPVHSHLRGFARPRYRNRRITPPDLRPTGLVTIDVHGSLDRAKDVSSFAGPLVGRSREECVRLAHADDVPLLILPEDTCCRRCVCLPGNEPPARATDRPRLALFRPPAKADGILRTRVPFTVTTRARGSSKDCSFLQLDTRVGSPLTPPTRSPHGWGQCALEDIASVSTGITRRGHSGSRTPFLPLWNELSVLANPRLGLTTQANQCGSVCEAFRGS